MKLVPMSITTMTPILPEQSALEFIGQVAGECYNSSMDSEACVKRALGCIKRGHHSPFEHFNITLKCTVDRGVSHALVRHRHCSFQQSSTIYQKFQECEFIGDLETVPIYKKQAYCEAEIAYKQALNDGYPPSSARDVLPNALATNLIITTNFRQWMYMVQRRCGPGDSDNMHAWCKMVREWFEKNYPQITLTFDCWYDKHPL